MGAALFLFFLSLLGLYLSSLRRLSGNTGKMFGGPMKGHILTSLL